MRPPHFPLIPLKHLCREPVAYGSNESSDSYVSEGVRFLRTTDITDNGLLIPSEKGVYLPPELAASSRLLDGDLLLSRSGTIGRAFLYRRALHGDCAHAGYLVRFRPKPTTDPRWLFYFSKSTLFRDQIAEDVVQSTIANFNGQKFASLRVPSPPLSLQRRIADFLDIKTAAIDELIAKKERLAALLQEKRQAVITQAVTKGLDPNVKMKESGVEWIGRVPEHWDVTPLRRVVARFVDYRGRTPTKVDDGIPLITAGAVRDGRIDHARAPEYMEPSEYDDFMRRGRPELDDVVFTTEAPLGEVALVEDASVAFAQRIILFKLNARRMLSGFLRLYYLSDVGRSEVASRASGSTAEGIRADRLRASLVLVPPIDEQRRVVHHVERALQNHEPIRAALDQQLAKLREYRQSLITAAVTGKLDVTADERAVDDRLTALEASG